MILTFTIALLITGLNTVKIFSFATSVITVGLVVIGAVIAFRGAFLVSCISGLLAYIVIYSVDYIVVILMGLLGGTSENFFTSFVSTPGIQRVIFLVTDKSCDIFLYFLLKKNLSSLRTLTKRLQWILLGLCIVSYTAMQVLFHIVLVSDISTLQLAVVFSWTFVVGFVAIITAFFVSLTKIEHDKQTEEILRAENVLMEKNYRQLHRYQENCAKDLHDYKHHLIAVKGLVLEEHPEKVPPYVDSLLAASYGYSSQCHSGNDTIDAVINCKIPEAEELSISFNFVANLHTSVNIDPVDLCGVLANQLDNAFDACKKIAELNKRLISVEIKQVQDFVFLKVENSVAYDPFEKDGSLISTKEDQSAPHGLGLINIRSIAEKYEGSVRNECQNGIFISSVSLCQKPFDT